eukprot:3712124-Rhodomonas_salina.1
MARSTRVRLLSAFFTTRRLLLKTVATSCPFPASSSARARGSADHGGPPPALGFAPLEHARVLLQAREEPARSVMSEGEDEET